MSLNEWAMGISNWNIDNSSRFIQSKLLLLVSKARIRSRFSE